MKLWQDFDIAIDRLDEISAALWQEILPSLCIGGFTVAVILAACIAAGGGN